MCSLCAVSPSRAAVNRRRRRHLCVHDWRRCTHPYPAYSYPSCRCKCKMCCRPYVTSVYRLDAHRTVCNGDEQIDVAFVCSLALFLNTPYLTPWMCRSLRRRTRRRAATLISGTVLVLWSSRWTPVPAQPCLPRWAYTSNIWPTALGAKYSITK